VKIKGENMNNIIFYPSYAYRKFAGHEYIIKDKPCSTFEEAQEIADSMRFDDDDARVLFKFNEQWYKVFGRNKNGILMAVEECGSFMSEALRPITDIINKREGKSND
jgi:hypothetical protein